MFVKDGEELPSPICVELPAGVSEKYGLLPVGLTIPTVKS